MSKETRLEDIPFAETLADEPTTPDFRDIFSTEGIRREAARIHWLRHTSHGVSNSLLQACLKHCPPAFVSGFGNAMVPLMRWSYRDKVFPNRISRNFEALTVGRWSGEVELKAGLDRWWHNIGRTVSEFCVVNRLWKNSHIEVEGLEHLKSVRRSGERPIFVSMHLGTWEALFVAIHDGLAGPSIGPFQPEPNRFKNRIVHAIRKERNQYLFPPGQRSAFRLHRLMASGRYSMTIFIDEVREKQVHLPCFGRKLPEKGNAAVAIKVANSCGGRLIPTYLIRTGPARFRMIILSAIEPSSAGARYDLEKTIARLNDIFEPIVLDRLEEWYMLSELRLPNSFETGPFSKALETRNKEARRA
ncbi:lysophospholipid acyltransferase family protein [Roseibium sp. M-1]